MLICFEGGKETHGDGERMSVNVLPHPENKDGSFPLCLLGFKMQ